MLSIRIPLPCPLNRLYRSVGYKMTISKDGRAKRKEIAAEIWDTLGGRPDPMTGDISVSMRFVMRDKRMVDIDAYCKQGLDLLEFTGIIENDKQVTELHVYREPTPIYPGYMDIEVIEANSEIEWDPDAEPPSE